MKVKVFSILFVCMLSVVAAINVHLNLSSDKSLSGLALENLNALAYAEGGTGGGAINPFEGVAGSIASTQEECSQKNGYWNELLACEDGGVGSQTCTISGEITIMGQTIKGSYTKGNSYSYVWARFTCRTSSGNCCAGERSGVHVK